MKHKSSLALYEYWNWRRRQRAVPLRRDIEPADMQTTLPNVFILECPGVTPPAFRLAGTAICSMFGRELRNLPFGSIWLPDRAGSALAQVESARQGGLPLVIEATGESEAGRMLEIELLLLPLASGNTGTDRFLGTLNPLEKPFWLDVDPIVGIVTAALRPMNPNCNSATTGRRPEISVPKAASIYRSRGFGNAAQRLSRLTVIEGGRED